MPIYEVLRFSSNEYDTVGTLVYRDGGKREVLCYTLEDPPRDEKIAGRTRIPAGLYRLTLREEGGFHQRYSKKFPSMHRGMIWVRDIPDFEYVLWHIGNTHRDTAGCLLLGRGLRITPGAPSALLESTLAYRAVYPRVVKSIQEGDMLVNYVDLD